MVKKVTYKLDLLKLGADKDNLENIQEEVGNYIVEQILKDCSNQRSAVDGEKWAGLKKDSPYYKEKKLTSGSSKANLELYGDMLDALEFKPTKNGIEIGIFDYEQAQKADNHNKFSPESKKTPLPKRQFIPHEDENFRRGIINEIKDIIKNGN